MKRQTAAFTWVELLMVIVIIAVLAVLLLPAVSRTKGSAKRAVCVNNLKQIDAALRMYADDSGDKSPWIGTTNRVLDYCYKELIQEYLAARNADPSRQKLFACPSDTFCYHLQPDDSHYLPKPRHEQAAGYFSSYSFNGANQFANTFTNTGFGPLPGIGGRTMASIRHPLRTALVLEAPAAFPYSWHEPKNPLPVGNDLPLFNNAKDVVGFVDGHVRYIKIYWNTNMVAHGDTFLVSMAFEYDPPPEYEYQWSGD
ncbi:MAG TPA: type II secretion system protein [Verrucomicrobiae bacterium]|nr:type II secretion system protein [Verrucomicrobiae bacterium]